MTSALFTQLQAMSDGVAVEWDQQTGQTGRVWRTHPRPTPRAAPRAREVCRPLTGCGDAASKLHGGLGLSGWLVGSSEGRTLRRLHRSGGGGLIRGRARACGPMFECAPALGRVLPSPDADTVQLFGYSAQLSSSNSNSSPVPVRRQFKFSSSSGSVPVPV